MLKKIMTLILVIFSSFIFIGCSSDNASSSSAQNTKEEVPVPANEFYLVYANPKEYKGRTVEFYGKVFVEPEKDSEGTYLQVFTLNEGTDGNTIVGIEDPNLDVSEGDIVYVKGVVGDVQEGTNMFGANIQVPSIIATVVEKSDYAIAFAPAIKVIEVNQEINQHGYSMTLERVEVAETETRAYLKIKNDSSSNIYFYSFDSTITQGANQISQQDNWEANYPEINSEILPGIVSEGVVTFAPINVEGENIKLVFEGSSDDYEVEFEPFIFECPLEQ